MKRVIDFKRMKKEKKSHKRLSKRRRAIKKKDSLTWNHERGYTKKFKERKR